jgi:hypothetical protein
MTMPYNEEVTPIPNQETSSPLEKVKIRKNNKNVIKNNLLSFLVI